MILNVHDTWCFLCDLESFIAGVLVGDFADERGCAILDDDVDIGRLCLGIGKQAGFDAGHDGFIVASFRAAEDQRQARCQHCDHKLAHRSSRPFAALRYQMKFAGTRRLIVAEIATSEAGPAAPPGDSVSMLF